MTRDSQRFGMVRLLESREIFDFIVSTDLVLAKFKSKEKQLINLDFVSELIY